MSLLKKTFTYGAHQVTLETGEIARQAHGAVVVSMDDTVVLCTVVGARQAKAGPGLPAAHLRLRREDLRRRQDPGGFFKREGRPSEKETLTSRLIDRPIRPLFPDGFYNEVQVVAQVLSCQSRSRSRHPGADRRVGGADALGHSVQRADRRSARRLRQRRVRAQPDRDAAEGEQAQPRGRRHASTPC